MPRSLHRDVFGSPTPAQASNGRQRVPEPVCCCYSLKCFKQTQAAPVECRCGWGRLSLSSLYWLRAGGHTLLSLRFCGGADGGGGARTAMLPGPTEVDRSCTLMLSYLAVLLFLPTTRNHGDGHSRFTGRKSSPSQDRHTFMGLS